jgi:hypothetical protein
MKALVFILLSLLAVVILISISPEKAPPYTRPTIRGLRPPSRVCSRRRHQERRAVGATNMTEG